jgi:hypothetical protein
MIRKLLLATLFILQISIMPSWGAETVLVDRVSSAEAEELDIQIPADVPPGYHEVIIEVYDDGGVLDKKVLTFCKEINGTIDWASNCPDLVRIYTEPELTTITERSELPAYDPAQEPDKSKDLQVTAFAALAALSAAGAAAGSQKSGSDTNARREEDDSSKDGSDEDSHAGAEDKSDEESDDLASVSAGDLKKIERDPGRGDLSRTWRAPLTERTDALFAALITRISPHSPILARTIADGNYLRAIFGSLSSLLLIPGAILGVLALQDTSGQALPPATWIVMAIIALATLDAMAGLVSGLIFTAGVVLSGNFASRDEILTIAGLFIIFYAPALLASAIRPLRRLAQDRDSLWERATDYGLVTLLSGWMMFKMIGALNALAGVQLVISFAARDIAILASAFILIRLLLEDLTTYLYPVRLNKSAGKFLEPDTIQKVISLEIKLFIFIEIAKPFVGYNLKLVLGTIIFAIPSIISIFFDDRFPKIPVLHRLLPSGAFKIVAMVFIGTLAAGFIQGLFSDARSFLAWSFVVLAIPGLILSLLGKMAKKPAKDWKTSPVGNTAYRILGFLVFLAIIQIVRGVDLYAAVFGK